MSVAEIVRVCLSRKYLMVIECDYTVIIIIGHLYWCSVQMGCILHRRHGNGRLFHLVCIRYFLLSAADANIQMPIDESVTCSWFGSVPVWSLFGEWHNQQKVAQQRKRRKKRRLRGLRGQSPSSLSALLCCVGLIVARVCHACMIISVSPMAKC